MDAFPVAAEEFDEAPRRGINELFKAIRISNRGKSHRYIVPSTWKVSAEFTVESRYQIGCSIFAIHGAEYFENNAFDKRKVTESAHCFR